MATIMPVQPGVHILTPVKDALHTAEDTIRSVMSSEGLPPFRYTVYDDFSTPTTAQGLDALAVELGCEVVHLSTITTTPSPNYLLVLQRAQREAIEAGVPLIIVESDVVVRPDTLAQLLATAQSEGQAGLVAAVTVDEHDVPNYPYEYAKKRSRGVVVERKHLSFCCTLLSLPYLRAFDFDTLDASKNWHDVTISQRALKEGFVNYLRTDLPVWHRPHGSRPWKQLKYTNPLLYYWRKLTRGLDKI